MMPSSWRGVTTAVLGNCGVGFAPVAAGSEDYLIGLMEGVEDIPGTALAEGIDFRWESYPEYLDALEAMPRVVDVAGQSAHGALRCPAPRSPAATFTGERPGQLIRGPRPRP